MIRNLKAFGLSLVALLAIGALSASAASAVEDAFTVEGGGSALVTGTSHDNVFKFYPTGAAFKCTTSKFAATIEDGNKHVTVDVAYEGIINETPHTNVRCTAEPSGTVLIDMNGCDYDLTGTTDATPYTSELVNDATVSVTCPAGQSIQVTHSLGVTLTIPAQTPTKGGVTYHNVPATGDVTVTATATGITTTCAPTFTCTLGGIPHHSNATEYTGDVTVAGFVDNLSTGTITGAGNEGAAKNIEIS